MLTTTNWHTAANILTPGLRRSRNVIHFRNVRNVIHERNVRSVIHVRNVSDSSAPPVLPPKDFDATKYRRWVQLSNPKDLNDTFTLMTFNLLSRHYMWKQVFGYLRPDYLKWTNYRFPLLNQTIKQFNCDLMCFQEMEYFMYEHHWKHQFPDSSYKSYFVKKPLPPYWDDAPCDFIDGVGIFVNTARFDVVDELHVNFGEYILQNMHDFQYTKDLETRVIPRNTVALILKLYDKVAKKFTYVTNTHLYWSPKFNDVKLLQIKLLLNILDDFIDEVDPRLIILGDLNSKPDSNVYKLLNINSSCDIDTIHEGSYLDPTIPKEKVSIKIHECSEFEGLDYGSNNQLISKYNEINNPYDLVNIYQTLINLNKLTFTTYTRSLNMVVDHIFISKHHFRPIKVLSEVDNSYCESCIVKGFPNEQFPSDHIPLVAEIGYKST